jgi:hypothetical protein
MHVIHASHGWLLGCPGERWQGNQGRSEEQGEAAHASYAVHPPSIDPPASGGLTGRRALPWQQGLRAEGPRAEDLHRLEAETAAILSNQLPCIGDK